MKTEEMLVQNIDKLHLIAEALIERETLEAGELEELLAHGKILDKSAVGEILLTKNENPVDDEKSGPKIVYSSHS